MKRDLMSYAASMTNPPKGYPFAICFDVARYRNERMDYWSKKLKCAYTPEVFELVAKDVIKKFGHPK